MKCIPAATAPVAASASCTSTSEGQLLVRAPAAPCRPPEGTAGSDPLPPPLLPLWWCPATGVLGVELPTPPPHSWSQGLGNTLSTRSALAVNVQPEPTAVLPVVPAAVPAAGEAPAEVLAVLAEVGVVPAVRPP
jgi:hypothetical protein